jgi:hypothetical protein
MLAYAATVLGDADALNACSNAYADRHAGGRAARRRRVPVPTGRRRWSWCPTDRGRAEDD